MSYAFELGPIRPPSEAQSVLLRVTRNCPWNKCSFCHTYRDEKFSRRTVEEVKGDIDSMKAIEKRLSEAAGAMSDGTSSDSIIVRAMERDDTPEQYYRQVFFWMQYGMKTAFFQDANSMVLPSPQLVDILTHFRKSFPSIERITTYARAKTVSKKTPEELKALKEAGLTRLHIGMESGCDDVLTFIQKGVTADEQIDAGRKAVEAGFDLSEYYMPGLGGRERWRENALETARVISAINPTFIRLRTTVPLPGTPLGDAMRTGEWIPLTEAEKVREIGLFIENLHGVTSFLASDHMMNLLEDIQGRLPEERERMLGHVEKFLSMKEEDQECFVIGKRLGYFRGLADYHDNPEIRSLRSRLIAEFGSVDAGVLEIMKNFI